ncbi:MAG: hypothetical protein EA376_01230 [Phycisphaeraceae bacterium]|nr:MAG: hypothetical protein EA376_01230 [Phycisphaeraceae bacterium]
MIDVADLLEQGSAFLEDQRHAHMTRPVVYARGVVSVEVQATVGRTIFDQQDQFGVIHRSEMRDYLVRAANLVLDGEQATPRAGDRVRENVDGRVLVYEVMAPGAQGGNEPPFRFSDPFRRTLRIHTKFIGEESAP